MSRQALQGLHNQLSANINSSRQLKEYRRRRVNTTYQSLSISRPVIKKQIITILRNAGLTDTQRLGRYSDAASSVLYGILRQELKDKGKIIASAKAYYENIPLKWLQKIPGNLEESLQEVIVTDRGPTTCTVVLKGTQNNKTDLFKVLQDAKRVASTAAIQELKKMAIEDTTLKKEVRDNITSFTSGKFLDLAHIKGGSVADVFGLEQLKLVQDFKGLPVYNDLPQKTKQIIEELELQLQSSLRVSSGRVVRTVRTTLQNARINRQLGATEQKNLKKAYTDILDAGLSKLSASLKEFAETESSDSFFQACEKVILNSMKGELNKSIKTSFKKRKINKSTGSVKKVISKFSTSKGNFKDTKFEAPRAARKSAPQPEGPSPLEMLAYINARITNTVAMNMELPGLEYDTGRFAQSVKALNLIKTRGGFPSIEYTYQRDPYQVFEMGVGRAPWATSERDPRKLIDRSIREIAVELLTGRLYTRRV
jgi:hypothetical protein